MGVFLEEGRDNDTKPEPGHDNCSTEICGKKSDGISFRTERRGTQNEVTADTTVKHDPTWSYLALDPCWQALGHVVLQLYIHLLV